ncbi:MAG: DUF805 domain-containing protein [Aerococcaceae bacterium]|nr:DUF805 domain-containing protein [Aerococcaceae bacterium]
MLAAYKEYWKRAFDFSGTTRRKAYWLAVLANLLILLILDVVIILSVSSMTSEDDVIKVMIPFSLFIAVSVFPNIASTVRRMRSAGYNPWKLLWSFVPFGNLYVLYCLVQPDQFD